MPEHRRRRATQSGGGKPLAPFGLRAARTRLLCYGSSMVLGHHLCRRASHPDTRRLQHGLSDFCHGLLGACLTRIIHKSSAAVSAIIRADGVALPGAPGRTARVRLRGTASPALSARRLRHFATRTCFAVSSQSPSPANNVWWGRTAAVHRHGAAGPANTRWGLLTYPVYEPNQPQTTDQGGGHGNGRLVPGLFRREKEDRAQQSNNDDLADFNSQVE